MKLAVGEDLSIGWTVAAAAALGEMLDLDNRNASALGETPFPLNDVSHDTLRLRGIYANAILGMAIQ